MKLRLPLDFLGAAAPFGPGEIRDSAVLGKAAMECRAIERDVINAVSYPPMGSTIEAHVIPRLEQGALLFYATPVYCFNPGDRRHIGYILEIHDWDVRTMYGSTRRIRTAKESDLWTQHRPHGR